MNTLLTAGRALFNENMVHNNAIRQLSSNIAAGASPKLQQQTPFLPVNYVKCYIFSKPLYMTFGKTNITCYTQC